MLVVEEKYYTPKELAERLQLAEETIRRYIRNEQLEAFNFGDTYRIPESAVQRFLEARRNRQRNKK